LTIDASGTVDGVKFDGEAQLGGVLRQNAGAMTCMMRNFYRSVNGAWKTKPTRPKSTAWFKHSRRGATSGNLLADFVASDAFRSAPALPVMTGSP